MSAPDGQAKVNGAPSCNGDLCDEKCHLAKYWCINVVFGLIRKRITCLVRISISGGPGVSFKGAM